MKNTLRIKPLSPLVVLGMLVSLSAPVKAEPGTLPTPGAADDLAAPTAPVGEAPEVPAPTPDVPAAEGIEAPVEEPTAEEPTAVEEPTAEEPTAVEEPTAEDPTAVEEPTAEDPASMDAPTAEDPASMDAPTAEEPTTEEAPTAEEPTTEEAPVAADTVVDLASSNDTFTTLVSAIDAADLKSTLMGEGPFTVFAPTNEAFEALPPGVLEALLKPENKEVLVQVLSYHVLPEKVMSSDLSSGDISTLAESTASVAVNPEGVSINDSNVIQADVTAGNGVIHVIDKVLIPEGLK